VTVDLQPCTGCPDERYQNKIIISQKTFITFVIYAITKENYHSFSEYITFSSLGGKTSIQTIFDPVPRCLKQVWCYRSHSLPYVGYQVLKVVDLIPVDDVLHISPQEKTQWS
jgi:hypothetical protein